MYDASGMEILAEAECFDLLAAAPLGRIVFTDNALPAIQPVNFALLDGDVLIRTAEGSKLAAAARHAVVAFEADDFDAERRVGWSVVIVGHARVVTDQAEADRLRADGPPTWAPGARDRYIRITPEMVTGRRIPEPDVSVPTS